MASLRLDKFLVFARFCKTRALVELLVEKGGVRINRQSVAKAHARLRVGDVLTLALPRGVSVVEVLILPTKRESAPLAQGCYREINETSRGLSGEV